MCVALCVTGALLGVARAGAQEATAGPAVTGRLLHDGEPVVGVEVRVELDGDEVGRGVTGPDGRFVIELASGGTYQVELVASSLPTGVDLAPGAEARLEQVVVQGARPKTVVFRLGSPVRSASPGTAARLAALAISGLRFGLVVALAAVGLTLVFGTTGIVNLAHGEFVTFGAIVAWYANANGVPLVLAGVVACLAGAVLGWVLDRSLWRPLERRRTDASTVMVVTIGLSLFLRNAYLVVFKGASRSYHDYAVGTPWVIGGVRILPRSVAVILVAAAVLIALAWVLRRTSAGTAVRAVGSDPVLAAASGIDRRAVTTQVWMLAAALAGLGGVMLGATDAVQWDMGLRVLLLMVAAVVLGGLGSVPGALVGGVLVGWATEISTYWLPADLVTAFALVVLIAVLLVKPTGLFGRAERIA